MITVACAMTLNGQIGAHPHQFQSLHNNPADHQKDLAQLRQLRTGMDGVIIGHNTFKAYPNIHTIDRPGVLHHVIMSHSASVDPGYPYDKAPLLHQHHHPVWWAHPAHLSVNSPGVAQPLGFRHIPHLVEQLNVLGPNWLIEGGGQIITAFLQANCVNRLHLTLCPTWLIHNAIALLPQGLSPNTQLRLHRIQHLQHSVVLQYEVIRAVSTP
jgi:riboflavin biosynthesis pyrimidine reductase